MVRKDDMKKTKKVRYGTADKIVLLVNKLILTIFMLIILYPLLYVVFASVSGGSARPSLWLIPEKFTLASYRAVFGYREIWVGFRNSVLYVAIGTAAALFVTTCCAYPLSVQSFKGSRVLTPMCIFTMYFGGGLIPTYLVMKDLHMINTIWSVTIPGALSVSNMIVMRTFFKTQVPNELRESAQLDGCGNIRYLLSIVLPLSGSVMAVIGLYYAVGIWNSYFDAMIYLKDRSLYPLTLFIREILITNNNDSINSLAADLAGDVELEERRNLMKYAVIVISSFPMMVLYPFIQRYFVKGVMIGAVKG